MLRLIGSPVMYFQLENNEGYRKLLDKCGSGGRVGNKIPGPLFGRLKYMIPNNYIPAITAGTMKHPIPPIPTVIRRIANKVRLLTNVAMAPDPPASKMATIKAFLRPYLSLTKPIMKDPKKIFIFKKKCLKGNKY